jgi:Bacterial membrane protein YfhO
MTRFTAIRQLKGLPYVGPVVLIVLPLVLYARFLFGGQVLYWGVYLLQFYPWRQLAVEQLQAGHWPLWNPYLGAGTPLAANMQTAAFYPLNALFLLMPVERAFGWELAVHVALAGLFAYYLGRTLGLGRFGALVTGLTYGLGGYLVAHWVFPSMVYAITWLPLLLAFAEKMVTTANVGACPYRFTGLLAAAIGLQLLAGHAQTSFYSLLIVAAFVLWRAIQQRGSGIVRRAWPVFMAVLWGLALAAIQLVPTAELTAHSQRAGTLTDLQFANELSFWPWRLISLAAPDFFGNPARGEYWARGTYWEEAVFVGVLPLLLAGLAFARWRRRALVPFFGALSLLAILLALGSHTPIYPLLFRYVPGFGLFQAPARLMIGFALGMAVLAGVGAQMTGDGRITPRLRLALRLAVLAGLGMAAGGTLAVVAVPGIPRSFSTGMIRLGVTLALAGGLLLARPAGGGQAGSVRSRLKLEQWQAMVAALIAVDLVAFGWGLAPGTDPAVYRAPVAAEEFLRSQPTGRLAVVSPYAQKVYEQYVSLRSFGSADPAYLQGLRESLLPDLNSVSHLSGVGNYDPLTIRLYRDLWDRIAANRDGPAERVTKGESRSALNLLGAQYLVSDDNLPLPVIYDAGPYIYRNDAALPAAFVVFRARVIEDEQKRLEILLSPDFDPRAELLLSRTPDTPMPQEGAAQVQGAQPEPSVTRTGPGEVLVRVDMAQPGYLVLTDTLYPGWRATVDGRLAEIVPADHAFRAVGLSAGAHTIVFSYTPASFRLGAWISLGAVLLLAVTLLAGLRRRSAA